MFELDLRHYAATMMHPKYRQLKGCSKNEREQTCKFIRAEMVKMVKKDQYNNSSVAEPASKKQKKDQSILER